MEILNLYAGIGGNRKLWGDEHNITAVEIDPEIANIYRDLYPNDTVIVGDAHKYLLDNFEKYDFIWSSPPCPTHSRMRTLLHIQENTRRTPYPDMQLYQEIILLQNFFKGIYVIENVRSYYDPLIEPQESGNHYFWCNFKLTKEKAINRSIRRNGKKKKWGFDIEKYNLKEKKRTYVLNNLVYPEQGLKIFNDAFITKQEELF